MSRKKQDLEKKSGKNQQLVIVFLAILAIIRCFYYLRTRPSSSVITLTGFVWDDPTVTYSGQYFYLKDYRIEISPEIKISAGDQVTIIGQTECQITDKYQQRCSISYPNSLKKINSPLARIGKNILALREKLIGNLEKILPPEASSLLTGIVWGNQGQFSTRFYQDMKQSGLLHVVVASGANVSSLIILFSGLSKWLGRRQTILITIPVILLYGFIVGNEPPILRAVIMGEMALIARFFGYRPKSIRSLFWAGLIMIIANPSLLFSAGFQLSFGASLGIILFAKNFQKGLRWSSLATTLSAQVFTIPLIAFQFNQIMPFSFLSNALLLWIIEPLMIWGLLLSFMSLISLGSASLMANFFWLPLQIFIWGGHLGAKYLPEIDLRPIFTLLILPIAVVANLFIQKRQPNDQQTV